MSYRRTTTSTTHTHTPRQRSYVVTIDAGTFANIEIVVEGGRYHRRVVWPPPSISRASTATHNEPSSHGRGYKFGYAPTSPAKRTSFTPLRSQQPSMSAGRSPSSDARSQVAHEWDHVTSRRRMAEERAREQQRRLEEARLAKARREAAEEARRRQAQQHQQQQQQKQKQRRQELREERRRQERIQRAREIANAWRTYEGRWALLSQRQPGLGLLSALTFERIPWPVADAPQGRTIDMLQPEAIREFLLSPAHSPDVSSKDRIRAALRQWHPDKFTRVLNQVMESDRDAVEEGMGIVVRCLNDMLEKDHQARD